MTKPWYCSSSVLLTRQIAYHFHTICAAEHVDLTRIGKVGEGTFGEAFKVQFVPFLHAPLIGSMPEIQAPNPRKH